jgi:PAS domain S-box-containing protein
METRPKPMTTAEEWRSRAEALAGENAELKRRLEAAEAGLCALRETHAALKTSEEKFSRIFQACPEAIDLTGLEDGTLYECNDAFTSLYGYSKAEVMGRTTLPAGLGIWLCEEDRARHIARLKADGRQIESELFLRRKDGSIFRGILTSTLAEIGGVPCNLCIIRDITLRIQQEDQLREATQRLMLAQERLQLALMSSGMGTFEWDVQKDHRTWDAAGYRLVGADPQRFAGTTVAVLELVHPEDREEMQACVRRALEQGHYEMECRMVWEDASVHHIAARGKLFRDDQGRPGRLIGVLWDISERKQAEAALLQERSFTRTLLDNLIEGVVACDEQGELVLFNRTLREWHGLDGLPLPRRGGPFMANLFEPDGITPLQGETIPLARALNGEVLHDAGLTIRAPGQPVRHVLANGAPILDASARRLGAVVVVRDVTRQRHMDQVLRKISVAVEQGPVTVVITDTEARIEYVNPKFTELTGYAPGEVLGQNPRLLQSGDMPAATYAGLWATITAGQTWKGEFHNRKKNGELFWESATIAPIKDGAGVITNYVAVKEDITGRRSTEQQLQQLNEELEERIRRRTGMLELANAELDAFSYSVSHDLRTPLRGIDGFSQALVEECGDQLSAAAKHYLQRVRAGTQRMGQLIDDLLRLSRVSRSSLNRQRLDLSSMAGGLLEEIRQGDPGRPLEVSLEPGLTASGDQGLIRSVLQNLLGNAWKYTANVPVVKIEVFRAVQPDGTEAFAIRDNGAGFDMAYAGKLFAPFQRLHSTHDFEGSGIGLAIVQRIIRRHGGQVWATGMVDQGATFFFTLPDRP